ncbi:hypothetical protein [Streptomyces sp. IB2014 016-6]|uniref:hypothetical protein n=1 Tax=Streptomyces sp. IB2014 016-6 TaxID=2517818 RepID=UPI0011C7A6BC|nr:hypothetical protein [Streptomyces sp. IB2014 016-6]TXL84702.1 hypothetical protein EW053_33245 [Streptomyces sp. IB2014 016-6]
MAQHGPALPYDTAWALITLHTAPEETDLVRAWAGEHPDSAPGVHHDHWDHLSSTEQRRRRTWLQRHGHSPIQLLSLDQRLIHSTGLYVLDWGHPPEPGNTANDEHVTDAIRKEPAPQNGDTSAATVNHGEAIPG